MKNFIPKILKGLTVVGLAPLLMAPTVIPSPYDYTQREPVYERITLSQYDAREDCGLYTKDYRITISSKYKMFANYTSFPYQDYDHPIKIESELYEIIPRIKFKNKATVELIIDEENFKNLIELDGFTVYYPAALFDRGWIEKVWEKSYPSSTLPFMFYKNMFFYSNLSTTGLDRFINECAEKTGMLQAEERKRIEEEKPINKLKSFFNLD